MKTAERLLNDARKQNMPVFVLVAKDKCSLRAISSYCAECFKEGCPEHFIFEIDEVYKEFVYDGLEFMSFTHLDDIADRVILTDSISKRYSACGARIGCIASKNKDLMKQVMKLAQGRLCVATIEQIGAANLINVPDSYIEEVKQEYCKRRDVVYGRGYL